MVERGARADVLLCSGARRRARRCVDGDRRRHLRRAGDASHAGTTSWRCRRARWSCSGRRTRSSSCDLPGRSSPATMCPLLAGDTPSAWRDVGRRRLVDVDGDELQRRAAAGHRRPRVCTRDLALLLSTSGSTGSPEAGPAVARATCEQRRGDRRSTWRSTPADRGITSLPLHYCYGLSVLHSHLVAGAGVVTDGGVRRRPVLRRGHAAREVTNLAGVPHTYELLERAGPELVHVPSLRFMTQAGGRLRPDGSGRGSTGTAAVGRRPLRHVRPDRGDGADGLPAARGWPRRHPRGDRRADPRRSARAAPGRRDARRRRRARLPRAQRHARLRARRRPISPSAPTLDELATGDLARYDADDGVFEIVGRRSRFVKPFGLRIDLDAVEADLGRRRASTAWSPATTSCSSCALPRRDPTTSRSGWPPSPASRRAHPRRHRRRPAHAGGQGRLRALLRAGRAIGDGLDAAVGRAGLVRGRHLRHVLGRCDVHPDEHVRLPRRRLA